MTDELVVGHYYKRLANWKPCSVTLNGIWRSSRPANSSSAQRTGITNCFAR